MPTAFNWKYIFLIFFFFLSGKPGATDKTSPEAFYKQNAILVYYLHTVKKNTVLVKYFYIYTHISPAMPWITGTMLIYTEWCSATMEKGFHLRKTNNRYQR